MFSSNGSQVSSDANYIEDVFSTWLYKGNGTSQTITNGIDLSTKGGLVWVKDRTSAIGHYLVDTVRGEGNYLASNATTANTYRAGVIGGFSTTGFSVDATLNAGTNTNNDALASWTFREQAKFFDVVTYTGTGTARTVAHSLGSVPSCMIVKATSTTGSWKTYHLSLGNTQAIDLNTTSAASASGIWNNTTPTATEFTVTDNLNDSGVTYVAYLFAHNAGGFGLTGADNVISCGYGTAAAGDGPINVTLGYEPQFILMKNATAGGNWWVWDTMRGIGIFSTAQTLLANTSEAETTLADSTYPINITSTGFSINAGYLTWGSSSDKFIYIAIRKGPMKVPTDATKVFTPIYRSGTGANPTTITAGITPDLFLSKARTAGSLPFFVTDRFRGGTKVLSTSNSIYNTEATDAGWVKFDKQTTVDVEDSWLMGASFTFTDYFFRRAPSFFDEVCYTGTGSARTVSHNLQAVPELILLKSRSIATDWNVYSATVGATGRLTLNYDLASQTNSVYWNDTAPTSSVFTVGTGNNTNGSAETYVAYLFATCAGVSKVGSYTGNGSNQTINCGFTAGARFILIKRTDSTGDWYVWDTARGIVSGDDAHLSLNSTAVEVTNDDTIDTASSGFVVNQLSATNVNVNAATYIFLAIA